MNSTTGVVPQRPPLTLLGTEPIRAAIEFVAHQFSCQPEAPQGDGHAVILFPGLGSDGTALIPLRNHCRSLVYHAVDWGRGLNKGPSGQVDAWLTDLSHHVEELIGDDRRAASLVGWSLGGLYARELGKRLSPRIRQVITIGTPFNGDPAQTNVGWLYSLLNGCAPKPDRELLSRLRTPPPVPTTSIYSRSDGVVSWQSCVHERPGKRVQDVEVSGSHIGMGWNRQVLAVVGDRLRQKPGRWRPYVDAEVSPAEAPRDV